MKRYSKLIPQGTRDLLFEECDDRRNVESILSALFKEYNYRKVMTPTVEFFDVFSENDLGIEAEEMYKLSDSLGRTTVLRPDNTAPIARLVATRLSKEDFPVKLYYNQNVYVRNKSLAGRADETEQSGIEFIGDGSIDADIEVISMAYEALKRNNVASFKLELCHAGFFKSILNKMNISATQKADICKLIEGKNYAALGDMLAKFTDSKEADVIKKLPRLFGDVSVINEAKKLYNDEKSNEALDYLRRVYEKLCDMGLGDNITIDLGLVNRSNYYTGVIFRGYAEGSGLTIVSGGRYDNLLGEFGLDAPAIGFGVNVNALCDVMREEINVDRPIRIALTKGRLEKSSISLFQKMGLDTTELENKGRRLILPVGDFEAVLSKAPDVITYVEHGVCDIGVVGKDTIVSMAIHFMKLLTLISANADLPLLAQRVQTFSPATAEKLLQVNIQRLQRHIFNQRVWMLILLKLRVVLSLLRYLALQTVL